MRKTTDPGPRLRGHRHTPAGALFSSLILEVFRLNGALLAAGDELGRTAGVTASRWQVLGAIAIASQPLTASEIARAMGVTRQSVQRQVDEMERSGLLQRVEHLGNRRVRPARMTARGHAAYTAVFAKQVPWANACAAAVHASRLRTTLDCLRQLLLALDPPDPRGQP